MWSVFVVLYNFCSLSACPMPSPNIFNESYVITRQAASVEKTVVNLLDLWQFWKDTFCKSKLQMLQGPPAGCCSIKALVSSLVAWLSTV